MNKIRLGFSTFTIEPAVSGRGLDGIGVYTKSLLEHLSAIPQLAITPYTFSRFARQTPQSVYPNGKAWTHSFTTATVYSLLCQRSLLNAEVDLFHATDYRIPKLKCPVVATLHDAVPLQFPHWVNLRWRTLKNFVMRSSVKWAKHIIALTHAVVPDIVEYYKIDEKNISVVHSGVSAKWFSRSSPEQLSAIRQRYHLPDNFFLFVGTLQPRKNILRILQAYQALASEIKNEFKLVIVGKVGWNIDNALALLHKMINAGEVIWLDNLYDEYELRAIYQLAKVLVFPSLYEGFGLPILEAFASGLPVLTSTVSAMPEIAGDAAILVDPYDKEAIMHGLQKMAEDNVLREQCIANGLLRAQEKSWGQCALRTLEVYQKLL